MRGYKWWMGACVDRVDKRRVGGCVDRVDRRVRLRMF